LRQPGRSGLCAAIPRRRRAASALSESIERQVRSFRLMLRQPRLALHDPFHNLTRSHTLAGQGISIGPLLKCFLHCDLAGVVGYGQGFVHTYPANPPAMDHVLTIGPLYTHPTPTKDRETGRS